MEELKAVMDALQGLGGDAKVAFIWWLVVRYGCSYLLMSGTIIISLIITFKVVSPIVQNSFFIAQIKSIFGYYEASMSDEHRAEILGILHSHKNKCQKQDQKSGKN